MSYDLTMAAHRTRKAIEAWATEQGFAVVAAADGHSYDDREGGRGEVPRLVATRRATPLGDVAR